MILHQKDKTECTGCGACQVICPRSCIQMVRDEEGFLYPKVNDGCITCGACERICPVETRKKQCQREDDRQPIAYAFCVNNKKVWNNSSSGGAFYEICRAFCDDKTAIVGAAWDGLCVKHVLKEDISKIGPLCKSKYIASEMSDVYVKIREYLTHGYKIVVSGTPCQIAALKIVFKKYKENILYIDLICHGVGSPDVFNRYINMIEEKYYSKVYEYQFRSKRMIFETDYLSKITFNNGNKLYFEKDRYVQLFLNQKCIRPSCNGECVYQTLPREGDLTIGDLKGISRVIPKRKYYNRNYSTILVNTELGMTMLRRILLEKDKEVYICDLNKIKEYNPLVYRKASHSSERDKFFREFLDNSSEAILKNSTEERVKKTSVKLFLKRMIPETIQDMCFSIVKNNSR